ADAATNSSEDIDGNLVMPANELAAFAGDGVEVRLSTKVTPGDVGLQAPHDRSSLTVPSSLQATEEVVEVCFNVRIVPNVAGAIAARTGFAIPLAGCPS